MSAMVAMETPVQVNAKATNEQAVLMGLPNWYFPLVGVFAGIFDIARAYPVLYALIPVVAIVQIVLAFTVLKARIRYMKSLWKNKRTRFLALGLLAVRFAIPLRPRHRRPRPGCRDWAAHPRHRDGGHRHRDGVGRPVAHPPHPPPRPGDPHQLTRHRSANHDEPRQGPSRSPRPGALLIRRLLPCPSAAVETPRRGLVVEHVGSATRPPHGPRRSVVVLGP
ncbi:hypothetical protein ACIQVR_05000 [Streptomyces xanthochromogenes]|uniref:hypothetical protein n=1 Tax=Streptomyces xanthochromogenes TaxID=67384 RepID=UPI0037F836EF